jgi:glycosyltransferase involved in cell wall biosynthesis
MTIRLVFFVDSPSARAHANAATRLAAGIVEIGDAEATLLCYSEDPAPAWLPSQVRVERLGVDRALRSLPSLARYLRRNQPDVLITRQVHANFVALAATALARLGAGSRWRGKLILVQDHPIALSHAANRRDNKWLAKLSYRFADGVISPSPTVQDDIVRWCHLDPASTALVPNPIPKFTGPDLSPPHPWLKDGEPPVFVNTSNMMPWKRLDLLIEAFADVSSRHAARLILVGIGPERENADAKIRQFGLVGRAETVGWVEDPLQYAAFAQAYVHASDEEGFAQVLTEAMSVGCPVVTTDAQGGGPRFVTDGGKYGLLTPMGDRASLAAAMERILQPEVRAEYSVLGLQRSEEMSPAASASALMAFLADRLGVR